MSMSSKPPTCSTASWRQRSTFRDTIASLSAPNERCCHVCTIWQLMHILRLLRHEPIEKGIETGARARERAGRGFFEDDRVGVLGVVGWPEADRPRIHPFIARANLRGTRFTRDFNAGDIERLHRRVAAIRGYRHAHAIAYNLQVLIRNVYRCHLRSGRSYDLRREELAAICDRRSKHSGLQRRDLKTELADRGVIRVADAPRIVFAEYFELPFGRRDGARLLAAERKTGNLPKPKTPRILINARDAEALLPPISAADGV